MAHYTISVVRLQKFQSKQNLVDLFEYLNAGPSLQQAYHAIWGANVLENLNLSITLDNVMLNQIYHAHFETLAYLD